GYSQLDATDTVGLGSSTLAVNLDRVVPVGTAFTIVHAAGRLTGVFAGHPSGTTFVAGNGKFRIDYTDNDVVLTTLQVFVPTTLQVSTAPTPAIAGSKVFTVTFVPSWALPRGMSQPAGNVGLRVGGASGAVQKQTVRAGQAQFNVSLRSGANTIDV